MGQIKGKIKALLRYRNGDVRITKVHSSENAQGDIYLTEWLRHFSPGDEEATVFRFSRIAFSRGRPIAEFSQVEAAAAPVVIAEWSFG